MGNQHDKAHHAPREGRASGTNNDAPKEQPKFQTFKNKYETIEEVQDALRSSGLEGSSLIIGEQNIATIITFFCWLLYSIYSLLAAINILIYYFVHLFIFGIQSNLHL